MATDSTKADNKNTPKVDWYPVGYHAKDEQ
jgi:hypothetical protein